MLYSNEVLGRVSSTKQLVSVQNIEVLGIELNLPVVPVDQVAEVAVQKAPFPVQIICDCISPELP